MKRLKQHWSARPLSWLLSVALVWPALFYLLAGGTAAQAQTASRTAQPLWAVLDFENHTGYGGPEVGREASDAFVVELGKSNKYDVLSRQETQQGLANTGQTLPLDVIGLQRLGRTLQVNAIATGEVAAVSFSNSPRQATASVVIRVIDSNTGELVNGALAQGTSNPRAISTGDDDSLVNEAINNAAFAAVRQIIQFNLPKATVLNNEDQDRVLLNKGTRDGVYDGLDMVVTRNGNEVGRIRVSNASADQSDAVVTRRGLGIQPQDRATAIYQLPNYAVRNHALVANSNDVNSDGASTGGHRHGGFSGIAGILVAILAGALLLSLVRRGNSSGSLGGATIGKPLAVEGREDVVGGTGIAPGTDQWGAAVTAIIGAPPPQPADYLPISVRLSATTGNIAASNFVEYHIYRSDFPALLQDSAILTTTVGTSGNTGNTGGNTSGTITNFGQVPILTFHGNGQMLIFDDGGDKLGISASKPQVNIGGNTSGNTGNGGGGNTASVETVSISGQIPGTGIQHVGDRLQYFIEALYLNPQFNNGGSTSGGNTSGSTSGGNTSGGGTSGGNTSGNNTGGIGTGSQFQQIQLTGRTPTNFITYLDPVNFTVGSGAAGTGGSFGTSTSPDNVIVSVPSTRGADDYVLELATDPGFGTKARLTPDTTGPYSATTAAPRAGNAVSWFLQTGSRNGSLRSRFPTASQIFARVGARDSRNGPSESANPYIYSDPISVPSDFVPNGGTTGSGPPAAPSVVKSSAVRSSAPSVVTHPTHR